MKLSLRNIATALLFSGFLHATAEAPDSTIVDRINASETIEVIQPAALQQRLIPNREADAATSANHATPAARSGFRIQIFDSNARGARNEAQGRKRALESRFSKMRAYVTFDSPYWRVRVGDFHTRAEAEHALTELRRSYPGSGASFRIVRDRIN